jgi:hypothetical protein
MLTKHDKKGPELFAVTPELLQGLENFAGILKKQRQLDYAELVLNAKTGCSKVPSITPEVHKICADLKDQAKRLTNFAEALEQLFPLLGEAKKS